MPYDINERDATGQNILYVACLLGNKKLLDVILKFKVKASRIKIVENTRRDLFSIKYNLFYFRKMILHLTLKIILL